MGEAGLGRPLRVAASLETQRGKPVPAEAKCQGKGDTRNVCQLSQLGVQGLFHHTLLGEEGGKSKRVALYRDMCPLKI